MIIALPLHHYDQIRRQVLGDEDLTVETVYETYLYYYLLSLTDTFYEPYDREWYLRPTDVLMELHPIPHPNVLIQGAMRDVVIPLSRIDLTEVHTDHAEYRIRNKTLYVFLHPYRSRLK